MNILEVAAWEIVTWGVALEKMPLRKYFPKGLLTSGKFPRVFSHVAISQMFIFPNDYFPSGNFPMKEVLMNI